MEIEKAIYYLKNKSCTDCSYGCESTLDCKCIECELIEATQEAINALEKQVPKKPDIEGDGYADGQLVYDTWICPCCGKHYEIDYDIYDYCPLCGQRIDRGDIDG